MKRVLIAIFLTLVPISGIAGEKDDVLKCIAAAKSYAGVSLSGTAYKYDGGWFETEINWLGLPRTTCKLNSKVDYLLVDGRLLIIDGFSGGAAKQIFTNQELAFNLFERDISSRVAHYKDLLKNLKVELQKPKIDPAEIYLSYKEKFVDLGVLASGSNDEIGNRFSTVPSDRELIAKLIETEGFDDLLNKQLGEELTSARLDLTSLNRDIASKNLEVKNFVKKSAELSNELHKLEVYQREIADLQAKVAETNKALAVSLAENAKIKKMEEQLNAFKIRAAAYEVSERDLNTRYESVIAEKSRIEAELARYSTPLEPLLNQVKIVISNQDFATAKILIEKIKNLPTFSEDDRKLIIELGMSVARKIPEADYQRNLDAYLLLADVDPESDQFVAKIEYYRQKVAKSKESSELDEFSNLIKNSDDFSKYGDRMVIAALELVKMGKCTRWQIKDYAGWVRSSERKGQYFMDCGPQRVWFDPSKSNKVYADRAILESSAEQMCKKAIKRDALGPVNFHFFDRSYQVHSPKNSVTVLQGFDEINAFGQKLNYRAACLIQPDGKIELSIARK